MVAGEWNNFDSNPSLIFTSTNSGTTWATNNSPSEYWTSIASSADGTKLVAVGTNPDNACPIYTSYDSGSHWYMTASPQTNWSSVASSADGAKLVAAVNGGNVYTSMDSGTNWTPAILPSADWYFVASSADGTKLVAAQDYNGSIYTSTDSGVTWLSADVPSEYWRSVSSSADGNKLVAVSYQGLVYTFNTTPMAQLNIKPTSAHLVLSWIIPSTYLVLQQSSNLISWDDVTNSPLFNFTNMQNQVSLSPTNVNSFFRLSMH